MKNNLFFLSLIILLFSACTKEISIDIPDNERKLVVNGVFNVGEPILVTVSLSKSMLEKSKIESVNNAEIKLFEDGDFLTNFDTISQFWSFDYIWDQNNYSIVPIYRTAYYSKDFTTAPEKTYKIEVSAPGIDEKAYVEFKVPTKVPIIKLDTATVKTDQWTDYLQFGMSIKDPANEENFYLINLQAKSLTAYRDPKDPYFPGIGTSNVYIESDDVLINSSNVNVENGLVFSDHLFDGKLQNITFKTYLMWGDTTNFHVLLQSITEDFYNYLVSSSLYILNDGNPIAEPVSVKSNVKDGFGIVTAVNKWIDSSIVYIGTGNINTYKIK